MYLWIFQELKDMAPALYPTFLTENEAKNTFAGKYSYRRLTRRDILKGCAYV